MDYPLSIIYEYKDGTWKVRSEERILSSVEKSSSIWREYRFPTEKQREIGLPLAKEHMDLYWRKRDIGSEKAGSRNLEYRLLEKQVRRLENALRRLQEREKEEA